MAGDENGDGAIDEKEFRRAIRMLGLRATDDEFTNFCALCDQNKDGKIDLNELTSIIEGTEQESALVKEDEDQPKRNIIIRLGGKVLDFLSLMSVQTILYFSFVIIFQNLTETLRMQEEFYLDKWLSNTFVENTFDSNHNTFTDIRRVADVYEWGSQVLWSGLLGNSGPNCGDVGTGGVFNSATAHSGTYVAAHAGAAAAVKAGCNEDAWPDGEGPLGMISPSGLTIEELTARYNQLDWTEGIMIQQARVVSIDEKKCRSKTIGHKCYPEMTSADFESRTEFGYNWTHPDSPLAHPFKFVSAEDLGSHPGGPSSANPVSLKSYPPGGFVALIIPFLSDTWIADERGTYNTVTDFTKVAATRHNDKVPKYDCVRLVWNSEWIHQLCDPQDPNTGRSTGLIRAAIEEFWNDLKRSHFIDYSTRAVAITATFSANNVGVRSRVSWMFEFTSAGTVLPSYDTQTRVVSSEKIDDTKLFTLAALGFTMFFCVTELIELSTTGILYFTDLWNLMDWLNYMVFFLVWFTLNQYFYQIDNPQCSLICQRLGYRDDWMAMGTIRDGKFYLSLCVCIQLLKVIKFVSQLIPKMGLAPNVLRKALPDLVFFGITFFLSLFAFSTMFYIQLGPFINDYATQVGAVVATSRALFGDFDIDEVMDNSASYANTVLFLTYLFVAVFIMLSMFFAILGESQANFRDDQREARMNGTLEPEYGVITATQEWLDEHVLLNLPRVGEKIKEKRRDRRAQEIANDKSMVPAPVERIEARQLGLDDKIDAIVEVLAKLRLESSRQQEALTQIANSRVRESTFSKPKVGSMRNVGKSGKDVKAGGRGSPPGRISSPNAHTRDRPGREHHRTNSKAQVEKRDDRRPSKERTGSKEPVSNGGGTQQLSA